MRPSNLLLGVGNVLRRDDGVGVYVARWVSRLPLGGRLDVLDAGACGFDTAGELEGRERVVIVDAIDAGLAPGRVLVMGADELRPSIRTGVSLHDAHVLDALAELRLLGSVPARVRFVAVQVADVSPGLGLSAAVAAAVPRVVRVALSTLGLAGLVRQCAAAGLSAPWTPCGAMGPGAEGVPWN
jgi:hydrogenase maturation protease